MTSDPRAALATLISALERHLEAAASKRGEEDPMVLAAYEDVADAFEAYDEALLTAYGEMTPLDLYDDSEDEDGEDSEDGEDGEDGEIDDHYSDEDGEESIYSGLDDEEYDTDEDEDQTGS